ncbi:MAG: cyclase [Flavobacteriaceae bacterium]|nr:cyclase [Flavobacteriaceae bacterium]
MSIMKKFKFLSYFLDQNTPIYAGNKMNRIEQLSSIENGDSANSKSIFINNHSGTHIDFPKHFCVDGKTSSNYSASFWHFYNTYVLCIDANNDELINLNESQLSKIPRDIDFLILNTGFHRLRSERTYWENNPGIHPKLASVLRSRFKKIKAIGMDLISLTSFQNREIGRKAHKEFLCKNDILIIEDMDLNGIEKIKINKIICAPLLVSEIDGSPVTIIAEYS